MSVCGSVSRSIGRGVREGGLWGILHLSSDCKFRWTVNLLEKNYPIQFFLLNLADFGGGIGSFNVEFSFFAFPFFVGKRGILADSSSPSLPAPPPGIALPPPLPPGIGGKGLFNILFGSM